MTRLDDPGAVRGEYASEGALEARTRFHRQLLEGPNAEDEAFRAVAECGPRRVLEVGCGTGELAERVAAETGAEVAALDSSPRMVELTRARGVEAWVGDVQALPFADGEFDCAAALWMLYHVPDLDRGLAELARVLRPGGRLVATGPSRRGEELMRFLGMGDDPDPPSFRAENGAELLARHFIRVERRDVEAWTVFPDAETLRAYLRSTIRLRAWAERVPELDAPLRIRNHHAVFVAEK